MKFTRNDIWTRGKPQPEICFSSLISTGDDTKRNVTTVSRKRVRFTLLIIISMKHTLCQSVNYYGTEITSFSITTFKAVCKTHKGQSLWVYGTIKPTHKHVNIKYCSVLLLTWQEVTNCWSDWPSKEWPTMVAFPWYIGAFDNMSLFMCSV